MCIMVGGTSEPNTTKLIHVPVSVNNSDYNLMIYTNNLSLSNSNKWSSIRDFGLNSNNVNGAVMVVPFPVPKNNDKLIGMLDITKPNVKTFITQTKYLKPRKKSRSYRMNDTLSFNATDSIAVHDVGNYKISIAHSIDDVLNRINWNVFNKPMDFDTRVQTLYNKTLYPDTYDWVYVVAMAVKDIEEDGFGILYPSNEVDYFPIAHEFTNSNIKYVDYDVDLFYYTHKNGSGVDVGPLNNKAYVVNNNLQNILNNLLKTNITFENKTEGKILLPLLMKYTSMQPLINQKIFCNIYELSGNGINKNIYLYK